MDYPKNQLLPGSDRSVNDLGVAGANIKDNEYGGKHVTIYERDGIRYSYDTDANGSFMASSAHYTDEAAKLLGKDSSGKNRW